MGMSQDHVNMNQDHVNINQDHVNMSQDHVSMSQDDVLALRCNASLQPLDLVPARMRERGEVMSYSVGTRVLWGLGSIVCGLVGGR